MQISIIIINKNDTGIKDTIRSVSSLKTKYSYEIIIIDASKGKFSDIKKAYPHIIWRDYKQKPNRITIAQQRNIGIRTAHGSVLVFIDASCIPVSSIWLDTLVKPIFDEQEMIVRGSVTQVLNYYNILEKHGKKIYVDEAPTINLAINKQVFRTIGVFDESFRYGSDIDFTWRAIRYGFRIRYVEAAKVTHEFGSTKNNVIRFYYYGQARPLLYKKHPYNFKKFSVFERDCFLYLFSVIISPLVFKYPIFIIYYLLFIMKQLPTNPIYETSRRVAFALGMINGIFLIIFTKNTIYGKNTYL